MSRKTRKLIWSAPLMAVLAVAGALAMFVALSPGGAQADHVDIPGAITDLDADSRRSACNSIDVDAWDAPSGSTVDGYRIDRSITGWKRVGHPRAPTIPGQVIRTSGLHRRLQRITTGSSPSTMAGIGGVSPDATCVGPTSRSDPEPVTFVVGH